MLIKYTCKDCCSIHDPERCEFYIDIKDATDYPERLTKPKVCPNTGNKADWKMTKKFRRLFVETL